MMGMLRQSDAAIVVRVLSGNREAFATLVDRYERVVKGMALASCQNYHEAEDIAQDVFLKAFKDLGTLHQPAHFAPWLVTIARNTAVDHSRRMAVRAVDLVDLDEFEGEVEFADPAELELHRVLRSEVMKLAPAFREAILLHYFGGKTASDIAHLLGISRAAASKRIERARQELGGRLETHLQEALRGRTRKGVFTGGVMAAVAVCPLPARAASGVAGAGTASSLSTVRILLGLLLLALSGMPVAWLVRNPVPSTPTEQVDRQRITRQNETTTAQASRHSGDPLPNAVVETGIGQPAILGRILDEAGEPLPNARIKGLAPVGFEVEAIADEHGQYALEWLSEQDYMLRVHADGFYPMTRREVPAGARGIDFQLQPAPPLKGYVLNKDTQEPVVGARVSVEDLGTFETRADGYFDFDLPASMYAAASDEMMTVEARGYLRLGGNVKSMLAASPDELATILLTPAAVIQGFVGTEDGSPVAGATVYLNDPDPLNEAGAADENGRFEIASPNVWPQFLSAEHPAYAVARTTVNAEYPEGVCEVHLVLRQSARLQGLVSINGVRPINPQRDNFRWVFPPGEVEYGFAIGVQYPEWEHGRIRTSQFPEGSTGDYRFDKLSPGRARVTAKVWKYPFSNAGEPLVSYVSDAIQVTKELQIGPNRETRLDFNIDTVRVGGHAFWNGEAKSGGLTYFFESTQGSDGGQTNIEAADGYSIETVAGARLRCVVHLEHCLPEFQEFSAPAAGALIHDFSLDAGATINGSVLPRNGGGRASVTLLERMNTAGTDAPGYGLLASTSTDEAGKFSFGNVPVGDYFVGVAPIRTNSRFFGGARGRALDESDILPVTEDWIEQRLEPSRIAFDEVTLYPISVREATEYQIETTLPEIP